MSYDDYRVTLTLEFEVVVSAHSIGGAGDAAAQITREVFAASNERAEHLRITRMITQGPVAAPTDPPT